MNDLSQVPLTELLAEVRKRVADAVPPKRNGNVPRLAAIPGLIQLAEDLFQVPRGSICGPRRIYAIARARHIAMTAVRILFHISLYDTGQAFGKRHHGTVIAGCRRVKRDPALKADLDTLIYRWLQLQKEQNDEQERATNVSPRQQDSDEVRGVSKSQQDGSGGDAKHAEACVRQVL